MRFRQRFDIGVLENIKTLGIGLHQAVLDAVVDHLDEMSGADGTGMDITLFDARVAAIAAGRARDVADAWRQRREDRIEAIHHLLLTADHHAIAAVDAPDAARGTDIDIEQALLLQRLAAADVVLPERVA